ncbi:helix-turn-helix DNA binding protein [Gordonia phage Lilbeanie]|uniref:Helix-turn-helix DNA binding protein n=1 Tax=Gordonia phage Lilbeanie TaxID=2794947 RepID=A0A7T1NWJ3_9CAUD|nr:helix-turn-helix DNA binding protein [Gordonia phage Lilbeanie]QPO17175.1 helix-turn-helix DNA binding protein [Gordonia phage Lilbeanie]
MTEQLYDLHAIAAAAGISYNGVAKAFARSKARHEAGTAGPRDLPLPEYQLGQSPGWRAETILEWVDTRKGGGGE